MDGYKLQAGMMYMQTKERKQTWREALASQAAAQIHQESVARSATVISTGQKQGHEQCSSWAHVVIQPSVEDVGQGC